MTISNQAGPESYRRIAKLQRLVLEKAIKRETVAKQRRVLADYDRTIANNMNLLGQENLYENWEAYCYHANPVDLISEAREGFESNSFISERVSPAAVDFLTGGLKTQAQYLNMVEDYLDKVKAAADAGNLPSLQAGLDKAKAEIDAVSAELEEFHQKASGGKGFFSKLSTMPQRFLSRLGAGSTKDYQLETQLYENLVGASIVGRKGTLGLVMSIIDEDLTKQVISESWTGYLNEVVADPVSAIAGGMSSMTSLVGEITKLSASAGGRLLNQGGIANLAAAHPDIPRVTLENIVHLMGRNARGVAGDPSQITPQLFQKVGESMGWLPQNAAAIPAPPGIPGLPGIPGAPGAPGIPGGPDGGGSFVNWLYKLWLKLVNAIKGVWASAKVSAKAIYAKAYAFFSAKLIAIKAWLVKAWAAGFKGAIAAGKGLAAKASGWLGSKFAAAKAALAAKGGMLGLAGKGIAGLKAGMTGLAGAALSPAAAGAAAIGGAAVAGKSLYSLMSRRKKLENVLDFTTALQNVALTEAVKSFALTTQSKMVSELFGISEESDATTDAPADGNAQEAKVDPALADKVKMFANKMKKYVDSTELEQELSSADGAAFLNAIKSIQAPRLASTRGG